MNGKMLLKITLNEAIDPDLFAYLARFDNARLRAGAFRSIASSAVRARNNATENNSEKGGRVMRESPPRETAAITLIGSPAITEDHAHKLPAAAAAETPQFLVDEIADQFANF
jgi:hypothetical protein